MGRIINTVIIGAGQSGLSAAYHLKNKGEDNYAILEKNDTVASFWRSHYDSLRLITPKGFNNLPGTKFESKEKFPEKKEVVEYLEKYSVPFKDKILYNHEVKKLTKTEDVFVLEVSHNDEIKTIEAKNIIVASGYNTKKFIPELSKQIDSSIFQIHSSEYKNLKSIPDHVKKILVVGSGNSGCNIAVELSKKFEVSLSCGSIKRFPRKVMGFDVFIVAKRLGLFNINKQSKLGKRMSNKLIPKGDATYGIDLEKISKNHNIKLLNRIVNFDQKKLIDSEGIEIEVDAIIWATGFKPEFSYIKLPVFDENKLPIHESGITAVKGLYFLGLKWQTNISSFLLYGVGKDAKIIVDSIK